MLGPHVCTERIRSKCIFASLTQLKEYAPISDSLSTFLCILVCCPYACMYVVYPNVSLSDIDNFCNLKHINMKREEKKKLVKFDQCKKFFF